MGRDYIQGVEMGMPYGVSAGDGTMLSAWMVGMGRE